MSKESVLGILVVVVLKAQHLIDNHTFYKQDPYCTLSLGGTTKKTEIDPKGGQHPVWDAEFRFTIAKEATKSTRTLTVTCHSQEKKEDQLLGEGSVDISNTLKSGEFDDWVPLSLNGAQRGDVYLEMTFFAAGPAPVNRRPSKFQPNDRLAPPKPASAQKPTQHSTRLANSSMPGTPPRQSLGPSPRVRPAQPQQLSPGRPAQIPLPNSRSHSRSPRDRDSALPPLPDDTTSRLPAVPASLRAGSRPQQIPGRQRVASEAPPPSRHPGMAGSPPIAARPITIHNSVGYPPSEPVNSVPTFQSPAIPQTHADPYYPSQAYPAQPQRSSPPRTYPQPAPLPSEPYSSPYPPQPQRSSPPRTYTHPAPPAGSPQPYTPQTYPGFAPPASSVYPRAPSPVPPVAYSHSRTSSFGNAAPPPPSLSFPVPAAAGYPNSYGYGPPAPQPPPPTIPSEPELPDPYLERRYQTPLPLPPSPPRSTQPLFQPPSGPAPPPYSSTMPEPTHNPTPVPLGPTADELAAREMQRREEEAQQRRKEQEELDAQLARNLDMELNLNAEESAASNGSSGVAMPGRW